MKLNDGQIFKTDKVNFITVDGCKGGWCIIGKINAKFIYEVSEKLEDFLKNHPEIEFVFIDIPIGLSSANFNRTIDQNLRRKLKGKTSSVFSPPCREALNKSAYREANQTNKEITGKGLSIQAYNISSKIKEVDQLILSKKFNCEYFEVHPELCFKYLNSGNVVLSKKSTIEGVEERLNLISKINLQYVEIFQSLKSNYPRKVLKQDDILDSLAIICCLHKTDRIRFIPTDQKFDSQKLRLSIIDF
ncbi:DUF429 domain-containing protein [Psychroflexus sp. ALD_RP9]|uniref:DUF429 domain-containing protein n=1 Tax=Psychroflexus sp. ALD_RP9 TaxID=2777186 RepID=UPI001A8D67BA|nr:DUF429 domain-containing protein [Psychroflexus sp. ALD_RP9]QSS97016.1 DUF429 domain-containing protein [Psychroflexus sp. ALD_RP9]